MSYIVYKNIYKIFTNNSVPKKFLGHYLVGKIIFRPF